MADKESQERLKILREEKNIMNSILNLLKQQEARRLELTKSQTEANDIQKEFNALAKESEKIQGEIAADLDATNRLQALVYRAKKKQEHIQTKISDGVESEVEAYKAIKEATSNITAELEEQLKTAKSLDKSGNYFRGFAKFVDKIPGLSALKGPFEDAAKASRESAAEQGKGGKSINRTKAGLAGMKKLMMGPAGIASLFGLMAKFILGADQRTVTLARNLGVSKDSARELSKALGASSRSLNNLSITAGALGEAIGELSDAFGATIPFSEELIQNQAFLTKSMKLSAEEAGNISLLFGAFGGSTTEATNGIIKMNKSLIKQNGFFIKSKQLLTEISGLSADIQGYFGFSEKALARAVYQTRKFGISLSQANNIASSLLDFETSLSNELQLELMTNKALNFERARALAFSGDIAGASAAVLAQTQKLTAEQRKNPIILKAAADASGLSVEELNKAFLIQKRLNLGTKEYNYLIRKGSDAVGFERNQQLMMQAATREEYEKNLSIQEKFQLATTRISEKFEDLINNGLLDAAIDGLVEFVTALTSGKTLFGAFGAGRRKMSATFQESKNRDEAVEDFTIRAHPKDTLVMAGGTKFGDDTNKLLKELITAVKTGGDVYIDGAKVGSSLVMAKTKLS
jgi:hypothetical protein